MSLAVYRVFCTHERAVRCPVNVEAEDVEDAIDKYAAFFHVPTDTEVFAVYVGQKSGLTRARELQIEQQIEDIIHRCGLKGWT